MPEYKHRVTVSKSTTNNQISINIENMGDCIVDVSWNDCEDTSTESKLQKGTNNNESSKKKRNIPIWIKNIIDCKIFVLIVKLLSIFLTFFVLILIWGSLISPIKNPILWWFFIITLGILAILSNITVFFSNRLKNELINCFIDFILCNLVTTLVITSLLSYLLNNIGLNLNFYEDSKTPIVIFCYLLLMFSILWIMFSKKYSYNIMHIVVQFFLAIITIMGIVMDVIQYYTFEEVRVLYILILLNFLMLPIIIEYKQITA